MPENRTLLTSRPEFSRLLLKHGRSNYITLPKDEKWDYGFYIIEDLAQDQVVITICRGSSIETFRGLRVTTGKDIQSDDDSTAKTQEAYFHNLAIQIIEGNDIRYSEYDESDVEEYSEEFAYFEEQIASQDVDILIDDPTQITPDDICSAILSEGSESDMQSLREMILAAEDYDFTVEQSRQLAPWLLNFAQRLRDSDDPKNESAVWSAIRTGASMLEPNEVDSLRELLEPGHSIDTSRVTVKMIGRIFEAQPPVDLDKHQDLSNKVSQVAESLLNPYAITSSQSAAMAQLAIYALAAMASTQTEQMAEIVRQLGVAWFSQQTLNNLNELQSIWSSRSAPVNKRIHQLLTRVIKTLE